MNNVRNVIVPQGNRRIPDDNKRRFYVDLGNVAA